MPLVISNLSGAVLIRVDLLGAVSGATSGVGAGTGAGLAGRAGSEGGTAAGSVAGSSSTIGGGVGGNCGIGGVGEGSGEQFEVSLSLMCFVIEYGVIFLRNFLFLSVILPDPSTLTTY